MKKTSLNLFLLFAFLFVFPLSTSSIDWKSTGHDSLNSGFIQSSISDNTFLSYKNLTIQSADYVPVSYDFTGDGYNDLVVYDSNLLNIYSGNGYSLISQVDGMGLISDPFIFSISGIYRIIGFNTTNILIWNVNSSGIISFSNSVSIPVAYIDQTGTYANYYPKSSVNCYSAINQTYCIMKANSTNIVLFNFSISDTNNALTISNISHSEFYTTSNFKPAIYPTSGLDYYGVIVCSQSSRYGIALVNMTSGSIVKENCTISSESPVGNPSLFSISGSVYDIFYHGDSGSNIYIHRIVASSSIPVEKTNYPLVLGSAGLWDPFGFSYNGNYLYECIQASANTFLIKKWNVATTTPSLVQTNTFSHNAGGGNPASGMAAFSGSDYFYCANALYSESTNRTQTLDPLNTTSNCYHGLYSGNNMIQSCTDNTIRIYTSQSAPLTYPNTTLSFRNNISNNTLGAIEFFSYDSLGNPEIYGQTNQDGNIFLGSQLFTGLHNITSQVNGFLPIAQIINITNGTHIYYVYGQPNASIQSAINALIFDSQTGLPITGININGTLIWINSTSQKINQSIVSNNGNFTFLVNAGNYSLIFNDPSLNYQTAIYPNFYHAGTDNIEVSMTKVPFISQNAPRVFSLTSFVYVDLLNNGQFQSSQKLYNYGSACKDEVVWFNATTVKNDAESYSLFDRCGNEALGTWNPLLILDAFVPYKMINNYFLCEYNEIGTYEVDAYAVSASFPFNESDFPKLVLSGLAQNITINVINCSNIVNHTRIQDNTANNENSGSFGQKVIRFFSNIDPITNLIIYLVVWLIIGGMLGGVIASVTQDSAGYLYGFGVIGFFDTIFFTFIYPLLGGFILFSAMLLIILILTFRGKNKTIGEPR